MTVDVSICVATYRRPYGLVRLLDSLSRLQLPKGLAVEIIVVDNDAADDARSQALAACEAARSVRWFVEPNRNIALARNRAVSEARGKWIAFVDDDEAVDENWLAELWTWAERGEADGFFGPVLPRLGAVTTPWLDVERFFSLPRHPSGTRISSSESRTGNALIRRSLFDDHRFDPDWGRTGGSDFELFDRLLAAGACFRWCDEAIVWETIPARRHRLGWLARRAFRGGVGFTRLQKLRRSRAAVWQGLPRALLALLILVPMLPLAVLAGRPAAAGVWLRICTQAGHLWALAGHSYEEYRSPTADALLE